MPSAFRSAVPAPENGFSTGIATLAADLFDIVQNKGLDSIVHTKGAVIEQIGRATRLALLAVTGQGAAYFLTIVLARQLTVDEFEAYAVASAAFTLMVMYTPRGLEKYALRVLPALFERKDWAHAHGYLRFGRRNIVRTSLVLGIGILLAVTYFSSYPDAIKLAIAVSCLSLPAGALVHYYIEVLSANGRDIFATAIFRVAVPTAVLILIGVLIRMPVELSGAVAVGSWGVAWILILLVIAFVVRWTTAPEVWRAAPEEETSTWRRAARPFLIYRISLAVLAQIGIIALDRLNTSATTVGAYVAAIGTANLALVVATSTNRYYARHLSILIEQRDYSGILALRRERMQWLLPVMIVFLVVVFLFGRDILGFFRPEFANEALVALMILAVSTVITVLLSLGPTYLKYMGHSRITRNVVVSAAIAQIVLLILLVPRFAATGVAIAYAVSMSGMHLVCSSIARRELVSLESNRE